MRSFLRILAASAIVSIMCITELAAPASAQQFATARPGGRAGNWEVFLPIIYSPDFTINGKGGSKVDVSDDWSTGFGFGYNVTDNLQLNGLFSWSYRTYDATIVQSDGDTKRYSNWMDSTTVSFNGNYYFMTDTIAPFIAAGIGYTYINTNIQNGTSSSSCWYDPWFGYICSSYVPTKTEEDWSYNAGFGVRFDMNRQFSLTLGFYRTWMDLKNASDTPSVDNYRLDLVFRM